MLQYVRRETILEGMEALSRIVREFMDRFNLTSNVKAGQAMGLSDVQVRSFLDGRDVRTGKPFKPREATLRMMADKMNSHAASKDHPWRTSYQELMVAAGYLSQEGLDFVEGRSPEPTDEELARGDLKIPTVEDIAADGVAGWEELTDEQRRQVRDVMARAGAVLVDQILAGKRQRKLR